MDFGKVPPKAKSHGELPYLLTVHSGVDGGVKRYPH